MSKNISEILKKYPFISEILNRTSEHISICDNESRMVFINDNMQKMTEQKPEKIYGKKITEVYQYTKEGEWSPMLKVLETGKPLLNIKSKFSTDTESFDPIVDAIPIYIENELCGVFTVQSDLTKFKKVIEHNIDLQKQLFDKERKESTSDNLIGEDVSFLECKEKALQVAESDSTVMLIADTGCGKEVFARYIHNRSKRKNYPFLALNCAAIPESLIESLLFGTAKGAYTGAVESKGLFEQAKGGTLFLDEINSMPLLSQAKLLRAIEEKAVQRLGDKKLIKTDVRIISSCNASADEILEKQILRPDLFYRLAVVCIQIPSLAQRRNDIYLLTNHFISLYNQSFRKQVMGLDDTIVPAFLNYEWPGNVRQLKYCIESAMNFVGENEYYIKKAHLPAHILNEMMPTSKKQIPQLSEHNNKETKIVSDDSKISVSNIYSIIEEKEKEEILAALLETKGNATKAAKLLGLGRGALIYRMKKYNILQKHSF